MILLSAIAIIIQISFLLFIRIYKFQYVFSDLVLITFVFGISMAFSYFFLIKSNLCLNAQHDTKISTKTVLAFMLVFSILFFIRGYQHHIFTPPYYSTETMYFETHAESYLKNPLRIFGTYDSGLSPFYAPFFYFIGYNLTSTKIFYIGFYIVLLLAFYHLFQKKYPTLNPFIFFIAVVPFSIINDSMRRQKWHSVTLFASLALYILADAQSRQRQSWPKMLSFFLLLLGIFLYHGAIIYLPIYALIGWRTFMFNENSGRVYRRSVFAIGALLLLLLLFYSDLFLYFLKSRLLFQIKILLHTQPYFLKSWGSVFTVLFNGKISFVMSLLFLLGIVYSLYQFKSDWFARISLLGFSYIIAGLILTAYGLENKDENNFLIHFIIGLILCGEILIFSFLRSLIGKRIVSVLIMSFVVVLAVVPEWEYFKPRAVVSYDCALDADTAIALMYVHQELKQKDAFRKYVFLTEDLRDLQVMKRYEPYRSIALNPDIHFISSPEELMMLTRGKNDTVKFDSVRLIMKVATYEKHKEFLPPPQEIISLHPMNSESTVKLLIYIPEKSGIEFINN